MTKDDKLDLLEIYVRDLENTYSKINAYKDYLYLGNYDKDQIDQTLNTMKKFIKLLKTTKKMSEIKKLVDFKKINDMYGEY